MLLRLIRFGVVGVLCLLIQVLFLTFFKHFTHLMVANVIGFVLSAQVNFLLSYSFTWHDAKRQIGASLMVTWVKFNLVVVGAAGINALAFGSFRYTFVNVDEIAVVLAVIVSTMFTFCINHFVVLKPMGVGYGSTSGDSNVPARVE